MERYVRELADALGRNGADVKLVARRVSAEHPRSERTIDGVSITRFATPSRADPCYAVGYPAAAVLASVAAIRAASADRIVHSHFPLQGLAAVAYRVPFVHTFHAPVHREVLAEHQGAYLLPKTMRGTLRRTVKGVEKIVTKRSVALITLSDFMASEAASLGVDKSTVIRIPGGIDTRRFCPGAPIGDPWARERPGPLLFTSRRLVPRTGVAELVEAMRDIRAQVPGIRLAIYGRGPLEAAIRSRVAGLGLESDVRLLGWISDEELVQWNRAADLVVLPTQELEGFGLATAEALACGTPVVGTPAGATPELLNQLDEALVCAGTTPADIASAVVAQLRRPDHLRMMRSRARFVVHPSMSWERVADEHRALYERLNAHARQHGKRSG